MAVTTSTLTKVEFAMLQTLSPDICGSVAHSYQIGVSQQHVSGSTPAGRIPMQLSRLKRSHLTYMGLSRAWNLTGAHSV